MKWQRCFIDGDGNIWRTETLKKASEKLPTFMFDITTISLDEQIRWHLDNLRDYLNHYTKASNVNLETPIILRPDGYVMDGWHRIVKALYLGLASLPARQFVITPEPDFSPLPLYKQEPFRSVNGQADKDFALEISKITTQSNGQGGHLIDSKARTGFWKKIKRLMKL